MATYYQERLRTLSIHFESFSVDRDKPLGHGAFGAVYLAKCGQLPCAAKVVHPAIFSSNILEKFNDECSLLEHMKHPNIVLFLGKFTDRATKTPVLLMELLDESLTKFLSRQTTTLPIWLQVDLCLDVIQAITYLHANKISHRDLSGNNVLIKGGRQAKVSDLGMSTLTEAKNHWTQCPGADIYMPPEAVTSRPCYSEKLDCFSFGVLIIQIATLLYPAPDDRYKDPDVPMPSTPEGNKIRVLVAERERRRAHIELIDPNHQLLPVALECLGEERERPSAKKICKDLSFLKENPSVWEPEGTLERTAKQNLHTEEVAEKDRMIEEKDRIIEEKERIIEQKKREIVNLRHENEKFQELLIADAMKEENGHDPPKATSPEHALREGANGDCHVKSKQPSRSAHSKTNDEPIKLEWSEGVKPPHDMNLGMCTVDYDNNAAYFKEGKGEETIWKYSAPTVMWEKLPACNRKAYSWVVVDGTLTIVGGLNSSNEELASLISLTGRGILRKWVEDYPHNMLTKRFHSACVYSKGKKLLIVAGGKSNATPSKKLEVLTYPKRQWFEVNELPQSFSNGSAIICKDRLYLVGFLDDQCMPTVVYTCSVSELAPQAGFLQSIIQTWPPLSPAVRTQWRKIANLRLKLATCVSFMGELVALGGINNDPKTNKLPSDAIYVYSSTKDRWEGDVFTPLPSARYSCLAAVLPLNRLMIVGGQLGTTNEFASNTVEFAVIAPRSGSQVS